MQKRYSFAVILMIAVLALVPAVSAFSNPPTPEEIIAAYPSTGYYKGYGAETETFQGYLFNDQYITVPTEAETLEFCKVLYPDTYMVYNHVTQLGYGKSNYQDIKAGYTSYSSVEGAQIQGGVNALYAQYANCRTPGPANHYVNYLRWWIGYNSAAPTYNYYNYTITAVSKTSGIVIPRADVSLTYNNGINSFATAAGKTDLNGEISFLMIGAMNGSSFNITASKVGYNTSSTSYTPENSVDEQAINILLSNAAWDTSGTKAVVYLDIIDESTSAAISGATIGIKNTTSELNPWYYNTYPDSTIVFSTDGTNDLSVGQVVEFAGYKSGSYSAGHTDPFSILSPVSRASLLLSKSDVIDPLDIANGSYYWYPVTITDATTGNAISGSSLNYQVTDDLYWQNDTSATGKFNMTGKGPTGTIPFDYGDTITIEGYADGYVRGGFALGVDADNKGVTQYVSLIPSSIAPVSGEWTAVLLAYDDDTTGALSGVSLQLKNATDRWSKSTTGAGSATFTHLISGESYTLTATKSGYTTITKTITGVSGNTVSIDVPMSRTTVNPTVTTTATPLQGQPSAPANDDNIAGWMRTRAIDILDFFYFFIILGCLGVLLKMWNLI